MRAGTLNQWQNKMNALKLSTIILTLFVLALSACKKDNNSSTTSTISNIVQQGSWRITLYNDNGTDKTNHFTGYAFTFNSNGTLLAVKSSSTVNGTWNSGNDDSQNKLYLNFGGTVPFVELNNDWHLIEKTTRKIRLEDVSAGIGGADLLTFEKN